MIIEGMPNGKDYVLFYLKLLCESVDHEGNLRFSETIPYNEQMLATITNTNIDIVRNAIGIFRQLDLIEILDDGTLYMGEVKKMLGSETEWAEKKRIYREKMKALPGQVEDTPRTPEDNVRQEIEKEKELEIELEKKKETKKKPPAEPSVATVVADSGLSEEVKEALREFSKMRTKIKAGMTPNAMKILIGNLLKLSKDPATQVAILNQSIEKSWKGVYPLKDDAAKTVPKQEQKPTGTFYRMGEHEHTEQSDAEDEKKFSKSRQNFMERWKD